MTASNFDRALAAVLKHEGGFVNHPRDPGGATNLGVTIGTLKRLGIDVDGDGDTDIVDVKLLKVEHAAKVYRKFYWDAVQGDLLPTGVDYAVFDFAVNSGVSRASQYLQAVVGAKPDGHVGPITIEQVLKNSPNGIITVLCEKRMRFLRTLSTWNTFGKGWTSRVDGVRALALLMADEPVTQNKSLLVSLLVALIGIVKGK